MKKELQVLFQLAAKFFLKKYKEEGGAQSKLANELGITQSYLSSVTTGSRTASLELYSNIAEKLYGPLDKFLAVGRRIMEGQKPLGEEEKLPEDSVEHLIARLTYYVVDHKRIEKELAELKHFYETIVENQQTGILVMDKDHVVIYANKHMYRMTNIPPEMILGTTPYNADKKIADLEITEFTNKYSQAFKLQQTIPYKNIRTKMPDGEIVFISGWFTPIMKDKVFDGMICSIYNTTSSHILRKLLLNTLNFTSDHGLGIVQQTSAGEEPKVYFMNNHFRDIFGLQDVNPSETPFSETLKHMASKMKNSKKWLDFIKKSIRSNSENARLTLTLKNNKKYDWVSNPLIDEEGRHWGRIAAVKEIGRKKTKDK